MADFHYRPLVTGRNFLTREAQVKLRRTPNDVSLECEW
jgi:hypothetical protein